MYMNVCEYVRICMVTYAYGGICMHRYGYVCIDMDMCESVRICMTKYEYVGIRMNIDIFV